MQFPAVLVIGATGRLGRILRARWDHGGPGGHARWGARIPDPGGVVCDPLGDPAGLAARAAGMDAILCLAGVTPAAAAKGADWDDNRRLALAAMTAGEQAGAHVFLASSAAVYGAAAGVLDEDRALTPVAAYGRAKAAMENAALARAAATGQGVTILRIGNVAGADAALGGWRPGFALDVFADGTTPARSYIGPVTLADVLAALLMRLYTASQSLPQVLNIARPGPVEMGALLDAAGRAWTPRPAPAGAIARVELATDRLAALVPLETATAEALVAEARGAV
ncbi:MAG: NAD-dependent epimerase/dehydratase family protein [Marinibacterium sp.]